MLLYFQDPSKLKTKRVVYEETYYARDSGTLEQLKELTSKRKSIEESLNGSSHITPAIAREMAGGVTSPILQIVQWTIDLKLRWTSPLSGFSGFNLGGSKYFRIDDLRYELAMVLFLYGALMRERALEVMTVDLVESATLFRRAAGVYQHMAQQLLPGLQPSLPPDRPPEVTTSMATIMSLICLAEAQAVTVQKAEEKSTSGGLLAKLHFGVTQIVEEASSLLRASYGDWNDVSDRLKRFLNTTSGLHEARSWRYVAEDFKKSEHLGVAVGILRHALNKVQQLRAPSEDNMKLVFRQEVDALSGMLRKCEYENDFIWREKPPRLDELPVLEGRKIVAPILYQPFGLDREFIFVT
ncbi:hypothetical protein O6H91_06G107600 [Diphasiastrum complanatum]|uniref:Uncharacterized protein n=1 Tax=Diphasiastrum complanatum TaxID=34168 RepID=A0ACC2DHK4_DIPCM|nr:hypothetical protein O6H91_06G107600 [Diphasiastrum complanatum]